MSSSHSAAADAEPNPWLGLWLHPKRTIRHLVEHPRSVPVLLLAAGAGMYNALSVFGERSDAASLVSPPMLGAVMLAGALAGVIFLYFNVAVMAGFGRLLGGRARMGELRSAAAWSQAPNIVALACLLVAMGISGTDALRELTFAEEPSNPYLLTIALIGALASLWSLILVVRMVGEVQNFGVIRSILTVLALLLLLLPLLAIRVFAYQPFSIPSGSMAPTILIGDYIFANKFAYGYGRYSVPLSPPFSGRLWGAEPERGDIAVFRLPVQRVDYIKRIVGIPGDEIAVRDGVLTINGEAAQRVRLDNPPEVDGRLTLTRYKETLPNGVSYEVFEADRGSPGDNMEAVKVPAGHYFVIGDNRDNSTDSRYPGFGFIPFENLIGRASIVFFSYGGGEKAGIRWNRILQTVH